MNKRLTNRQQQAIQTRRKVYESAVKLFSEIPYDDVKIIDICKEADISVGVFYYYFENKEAIIEEGFIRFSSELKKTVAKIEDYEPLEKIKFAILEYVKLCETRGTLYMGIFTRNEIALKESYMHNEKRFLYTYIYQAILDALDKKILFGEPETITADIAKIVKGSLIDLMLRDKFEDLKKDTSRMVNLIFNYYGEIREDIEN